MDPNQCWRELAKALQNDDWRRATNHADDLIGWLSQGGFPPRITGVEVFDRMVAKLTCEAIACWDVA